MRRKNLAIVAAVAGASAYTAYRVRSAIKAQTEKLAAILDLRPGRVLADVGAGSGGFAAKAAARVGPAGRVLATDVDPGKLRKIGRRHVGNITPVHASQNEAGLPPESCDAILLRGSYHHFTDPAAMNRQLFRALRPGGILAVLDFPPRRWLTLLAPVKGAPPDRGGHGIPSGLLIRELTAAGFEVENVIERWFFDVYCAVFRKPAVA